MNSQQGLSTEAAPHTRKFSVWSLLWEPWMPVAGTRGVHTGNCQQNRSQKLSSNGMASFATSRTCWILIVVKKDEQLCPLDAASVNHQHKFIDFLLCILALQNTLWIIMCIDTILKCQSYLCDISKRGVKHTTWASLPDPSTWRWGLTPSMGSNLHRGQWDCITEEK